MYHELCRNLYIDQRQRKIKAQQPIKIKVFIGWGQDNVIKEEVLEKKQSDSHHYIGGCYSEKTLA